MTTFADAVLKNRLADREKELFAEILEIFSREQTIFSYAFDKAKTGGVINCTPGIDWIMDKPKEEGKIVAQEIDEVLDSMTLPQAIYIYREELEKEILFVTLCFKDGDLNTLMFLQFCDEKLTVIPGMMGLSGGQMVMEYPERLNLTGIEISEEHKQQYTKLAEYQVGVVMLVMGGLRIPNLT